MSTSQLNKFRSRIKNGTEVTVNLSSNVVGNYNDETNFAQKLLLTNTQILRICKAFTNGSSANKKFSKTQLSKIIQLGGFGGRRLGPLLKTDFSLVEMYLNH